MSKVSDDVALPLLIVRLSANCCVVVRWSLQTMASACLSISGPTVVVAGWPDANHGVLLFLFRKHLSSSPVDHWCFCWPQHFHKHCKDVCGCFILILSQQQGILSQHVCTTYHWLHCGVVLSESFTNMYINAGNFKFVSSKISHSYHYHWPKKSCISFWATYVFVFSV